MSTPMPTFVDTIPVYAGDFLSFPVYEFLTGEGDAAEPIDLTGLTWLCQWRLTRESREAITLTVDTSAAATGQITMTATGAQTEQMCASGVWDLRSTNSGGNQRTWLAGKTHWTKDVSHD